jgi:hypothetical protein
MDCSICYDAINAASGKVEMAGCTHAFHFRCISSWFMRQEGSESCPCCRHEPDELGRLPILSEDEDEEDEEDEEYEEEEDEEEVVDIMVEASRERAEQKYSILRATLTEDQLRGYAASKIGACVRGFIARLDFWFMNTYCPKKVESQFREISDKLRALNEARIEMRKIKIRRALWTQCAMIGRPAFNNSLARTIQTWVRPILTRIREARVKEEAMVNAILAQGSKAVVTWQRVDGHRWSRIVLNPEEHDAETFDMALHGLPPQSLAFEMARSVTRIQSAWRGYSVRARQPVVQN